MIRRALALSLFAAVAAAGLLSGFWARPLEASVGPLAYTTAGAAAGAAAGSGPRLLADDPDSGRIAAVLGDLDAAEDVAVVVPGSGQTRENFFQADRVSGTVPMDNGEALYDRMRAESEHVAVVVWLGYRPPELPDPGIFRTDAAQEGAEELVRLTRTAVPDQAHTTLACHSYGAVVCGLAATRAGVADDLVSLAGPGLGTSSAAPIDARVWATRAGDDWTRFVPSVLIGGFGLGTDPLTPDYDARVFTDPEIRGHEQYYAEGSGSLSAIAAIAVNGPTADTGTASGGA